MEGEQTMKQRKKSLSLRAGAGNPPSDASLERMLSLIDTMIKTVRELQNMVNGKEQKKWEG